MVSQLNVSQNNKQRKTEQTSKRIILIECKCGIAAEEKSLSVWQGERDPGCFRNEKRNLENLRSERYRPMDNFTHQ
jgi:hypothetical protein